MSSAQKTDKVPSLRFSEFEESWNEVKIKQILKKYRLGGNYSNSENKNSFPLIKMGNLKRGHFNLDKIEYVDNQKEINSNDIIKEGDLFFNTRNTLDLVGKVAIWRNELPLAYYNSNLMYLKFENNYFMNYIFNSFQGIKSLRRLATGTTSVAAIYTKDLLKLRVKIPSLPEQKKIASFLSTVDKKINLLESKIEHLEQYKKGVVQKIFNQEIRFKITNEEGKLIDAPKWKRKKLVELVNRVTEKNKIDNQNVLTISAQYGLISQLEFFNKSVSSKSLKNYYLLRKGDFAYNKSYSNGYPMGAIKRLELYESGVVSSLYICFRPIKKEVSNDFLKVYFDSGIQNKEIQKVAQEGARNHGLLNIGVNDFFEIELKVPSIREQIKIANFLSSLDKKIDLHKTQLEKMKTWKKGLLQKMFV